MKLKNDGELHIFTGKSRIVKKDDKSTWWRNEELKWSELCGKLSKTTRTPETYKEYLAMDVKHQAKVKDVGGFIGGHFSGTARKKKDLMYRELITIDIDDYKGNLYGNLSLSQIGDVAWCYYTTHKHAKDKPRYRLVIPLSRGVQEEEYQAVARKIAEELGLGRYKGFDRSTFDYARLMYWPSTSKDGIYEFKVNDKPFLEPETITELYEDWKDIESWPFKSKEDIGYKNKAKLQEDPRTKQGWVGAFCRAFDIHAAISTFLDDVYTQSDSSDDRYTYNQGTTSNGLVVYDEGLYCFSNHGTDPARGRLCNSFDLVRLHKFGSWDKPEDTDTPAHKTASYAKMLEFCQAQKPVKKELMAQKMEEARGDFSSEEGQPEESESVSENLDWMEKLELGKKGVILDSRNNLEVIIDNTIGSAIGWDLLAHRKMVRGPLPWRHKDNDSKYWEDSDETGLRSLIETKFGISNISKIDDALVNVFKSRAFHPVRQYVEGLKWDGVKRIETLLVDYFGAEDSEYVREVTRKTLVAAIGRIYRPGIKFDYVLVLVGRQGIGKSTFLKKLGHEWFSESFSFHMIGTKEAVEAIVGKWIVEIGELQGLRRAEIEGVKQFLSKTEDDVRLAYARNVNNYKRQNIFIGSTNNEEFLNDDTGNRRFWPVRLEQSEVEKDVWLDLQSWDIDQIWAEAKKMWDDGEELRLTDEVEKVARKIQQAHTENDPRQELLEKYLDKPVPPDFRNWDVIRRRAYISDEDEFLPTKGNTLRNKIFVREIAEELFRMRVEDINGYNTKFIHAMMAKMDGWERKSMVKIGAVARPGYIRKTKSEVDDLAFLN